MTSAAERDTDAPIVSVIIPCYNLGRYLDEAVDSVLAQSFQHFEIVVVDDGSTEDETRQMLEGYGKPRTRVLRSVNRGLSAARNLGISNSTGRYICTLDADDRLEPAWFERAVALLDADASIDFVSHWLDAFGDERWSWRPVRNDLAMLLDFNTLNGAAIVRRRLFDAVGGFDESMRDGCEDWEFWIRVTERGHRGVIIPEVHYHYRRRAGSMSHEMNRTDTHLRLYGDLVERHPESFRHHLVDLILRREQTISDVSRHIDLLNEEVTTWLQPSLDERRREVERARQRLAEIQAGAARERDHASLVEKARQLEWMAAEEKRRADWLEQEQAKLHEWTVTVDRQREERDARILALVEQQRVMHQEMQQLGRASDAANRRANELIDSRSWRLTAPLRRLARWLGVS